jgi:26S proteasome regulatory subunit N2
VKEAIEKSDDLEQKLSYTFTLAQNVIKSKVFRTEVLRLILLVYETRQGGKFDYFKICKCQFFLGIPEATAILLGKLLTTDDYLVAYQIAFDIVDNENQAFQKKV